MKKKIYIKILVLLCLASCTVNNTELVKSYNNTENNSVENKDSDIVDIIGWIEEHPDGSMIINLPKKEGVFYGVGSGRAHNPDLALRKATGRARDEISASIRVTISSSNGVTTSVSSNTIISQWIDTYTTSDGTVFVLVVGLQQATVLVGIN